jgi:superfamily II DNA/RNA helicase
MEEKKRFSELGVHRFFIEKLAERRIAEPTEIQKLVIPLILRKENAVFRSATGTGKTFAYLLPLFTSLYEAVENGTLLAKPAALIAAPTLELCSQIKQEADFLLQGLPDSVAIKTALLIGSANIARQIEQLKKEKPAVIVGNTARLLQLREAKKLRLENLKTLVLDEADKLVSENFFAETKSLIERINPTRQVIACSATIAGKTREILNSLMGNRESAAFLETDEQEILRERIRHWAFFSENRKKIDCLCSFLAASRAKKSLIFTSETGQVGNIAARLQQHKISADGLFSGMDKRRRKQAVEDFKRGRLRALVASDLAARGLDIPRIDYVIELDTPADGDSYIHRAGRTARAGDRGFMITIGNEEEMRRFSLLEKKLGITVYPKILYQGKIVAPDSFSSKS